MIDTIKLGFKVARSKEQLEEFDRDSITLLKFDYQACNFSKVVSVPDNNTCKIEYRPQDKQGKLDPLLLVEFSLASFVGNYYRYSQFDYSEAIKRINELLSGVELLSGIDIGEGDVYQVSIITNYPVEDHFDDFQKAFSLLHYPHKVTRRPPDGSTLFQSKQGSSLFYKLEILSGGTTDRYWQHERKFHTFSSVKKITGKDHPKLRDITTDLVTQLLTEDLERLNLVDQKICSKSYAMRLLTEKYGSKVADQYFGFLMRSQGLDRKVVYKMYPDTPRIINQWYSDIHDAGVCLVIDGIRTTLPKLSVKVFTEPIAYDHTIHTSGTFTSSTISKTDINNVARTGYEA